MTVLETERLYLRPINIDDKESIFKYRSDSITNQYQGWIPEKIQDVDNFIKKVSSVINIPNTWFQFVVFQKNANTLIGDIGMHFTDSDQVEIGCTINKSYHAKGYATEALKEIINYSFHSLKKHRIIASIDPQNTNSIRLVEKLGLRKEAHFIESIYINDNWVDDVVYAILRKEWN